MFNGILHLFHLHLVDLDKFVERKNLLKEKKKKFIRMKRSCKYFRLRNRILKDIAIGIKRDDLKLIHGSCLRVRKFIDEFTVPRNIFCV